VTRPTVSRRVLAPPEERGRLSIDHTVVRKIAQRAAEEVPGTAAERRRSAGLAVGPHRATAKVSGNGDEVDLLIDLALHYPAVVRDVADRIRAHVTGEIRRFTAYRVRSFDVTVSALLPDIRPRVE
jgi:uncharacterized alkaline shock family protein YloU